MKSLEEISTIELQRLKIQSQIDSKKAHLDRNKLGQFATPSLLAKDILEYAKSILPPNIEITFLDPAFGTGSFYSALLNTFDTSQIVEAVGYEIDLDYGQQAINLWADTPLEVHISDFTKATPPEPDTLKANLLICNPPYVRHHHIPPEIKSELKNKVKLAIGLNLSGLSGLYCYFLCISHKWMRENCLAGWLIPSEFMDVNYGRLLRKYLLDSVTLIHVHLFDPKDVQFEDALVSSAVVWFKNAKPSLDHKIKLTYGGSLKNPKNMKLVSNNDLRKINKWTSLFSRNYCNIPDDEQVKLGNFFTIKRGIATGANEFFILTSEKIDTYNIPAEFLVPILPNPRKLKTDEVEVDSTGYPDLIPKQFLLSCDLPEYVVKNNYPSLWNYLQVGIEKEINRRYLCRHRSPWYSQEKRPPAPFLCTYMGRKNKNSNKTFRFILNNSKSTASNVYLMLYPKPELDRLFKKEPNMVKQVWHALNEIVPETLVREGRVYGGELYKLEPKELASTPAEIILPLLNKKVFQTRIDDYSK
ncbi:MAG TPA: SAM-dependent DNA methyltransferase [Alphaproteobacteria bacterium]|nr:SAM-dependent DNA methyltransferase [Alphaproteobacteria bacterium]HRW81849.1 hypothetical protein [Methanothrix sp.]